jgi:excisionase family DNA binding protein
MIDSQERILHRDEKGRPVASDGYPLSGLATVAEVVAATGLSRSQVYAMIHRGDLATKRFGRSVRVPWQLLRDDGILDTSGAS